MRMKIEKRKEARYNPKEAVIFANKIIEDCRYKLSPNGFNLLMGLIQSIDFQEELFPEIEIEISGLFKFFKLNKNNNKRYEIVRDALLNITESPLQYKINAKRWGSIPWMSVEYNEEKTTRVEIAFVDKVMPYLLAFKENDKIKNYTKLFSENYQLKNQFAIWLYPFFRKWCPNAENKTITVPRTLKWLREKTFCEKDKKINSHFIEAVNAAIKEINKKTDVTVTLLSKKDKTLLVGENKQKVEKVKFFISQKPKKKKALPVPKKKETKSEEELIAELHAKYNSVEQMPFMLKEELHYEKNGYERYAEENKCIIKQINDKFFICT